MHRPPLQPERRFAPERPPESTDWLIERHAIYRVALAQSCQETHEHLPGHVRSVPWTRCPHPNCQRFQTILEVDDQVSRIAEASTAAPNALFDRRRVAIERMLAALRRPPSVSDPHRSADESE